jgi:serine-type D-Ala-D-Ala carboxypeptidase/endopeptidase
MVRARVTVPLDMKSTSVALSPEMKARMGAGHDSKMKPVPNWDLPTLAGAGALRSTANDMLTFLAANLGYTKTPLAPAMAAMLDVRRPSGTPVLEVALAWHIYSTPPGDVIIWHNGGTGGYRAFVGYAPKTRIGVVVLANAETAAGVDDIGLHLLNAKAPLLNASAFLPAKERKQVAIDPKLFDRYAGRYQLTSNLVLTITREGEHLFARATGQPKFELFAEGEKEYFLKAVDAQITFEVDVGGAVNQLVLHQAGQNVPAKRID